LFVLALLLVLTLGLKLVVNPNDSTESKESGAQLRVADFLRRQNFSATAAGQVMEGQPSILATTGACRMLVVKSPATGWARDALRGQASAGDHVFFVFRGKVYADQPTWLTVPNALWARFRRGLGVKVQDPSALAVIATANCNAERLPWNELN